jgi:Ca2+-binding EF-hand superfamily protein
MLPARLVLAAMAVIAVRAEPTSVAVQKPKAGDTKQAPAKNADPGTSPLVARYFAICDRDGDHSISYPEAKESLGLDKKQFSVYDTDGDGLISLAEFRRRYKDIITGGGTFPPPKAKVVPPSALPASADKVLEDYDKDQDGALDQAELDAALVGMGAAKLDPEATLSQFDHDASGMLETAEIEELLSVLRTGKSPKLGPRPRSVNDLFGVVVPRKTGLVWSPEPPRILGPVLSFRRLDVDGDGRITRDELAELQRPYNVLKVHTNAVFAALDTDGDGAISEAEFWASMGVSPGSSAVSPNSGSVAR